MSVLFSGHMMRSFINSLSSSQSYLHEAGKQLVCEQWAVKIRTKHLECMLHPFMYSVWHRVFIFKWSLCRKIENRPVEKSTKNCRETPKIVLKWKLKLLVMDIFTGGENCLQKKIMMTCLESLEVHHFDQSVAVLSPRSLHNLNISWLNKINHMQYFIFYKLRYILWLVKICVSITEQKHRYQFSSMKYFLVK